MVSSWWEIQIFGDPALEELLFWRLQAFGCQGTSSQIKGDSRLVSAYLHQSQADQLDLTALAVSLRQEAESAGFSSPMVDWQLIDEADWATSWQKHWHPQEVGDRLLIYPAWLPLPATTDRVLLRLNPGSAFGTGDHATTQLCLEAIEMRLNESFNSNQDLVVADIGCGTGILSIAAILLGADRAYAVDLDPLAVEAACNSRDLNQLDPNCLIIEQGSIERLVERLDQPVDGIFCNILAEVIIELIPQMARITKPNSWGIFSGILLNQVDDIREVLEKNGWVINSLRQRQDWCCINVRCS